MAGAERSTLVLASANPKKVAELVELIGDRFEIVPRPADAPETIEDADTLEGNAIKKALEIATLTGQSALADDTGLFVEALDGRPGVRSARFASDGGTGDGDADNVTHLLAQLTAVGAIDADDRRAEFRTVIAVIHPDGTGLTAEGSIAGVIADGRRGENGFGYDPVFEPVEVVAADGVGRTFAEMAPEEKAELSHRSRAMESLRMALEQTGSF